MATDFSNFDHILLDPNILTDGNAQGSPEYANSLIKNPGTGVQKVNITRFDAQHVWSFDFKLLSPTEVAYLQNIWRGGFGSGYGLRVRLIPDFFTENEVLGTSDGTTASRTWLLTKTYNRPGTTGHPDIRRIIMPVANTNLAGGCPTLYEADGVTPRVIPSVDAAANGIPAFTVYLDSGSGPVSTSSYTIDNTTGTLVLTPKTLTADSSTDFITITAHGFSNGNEIKLENSGGGLPAPFVSGTSYFVRDKTTNTFKLAATLGGSAIDITTNGTGTNKVSAPPVGWVVSYSGEYDTPFRFFSNSFAQQASVATEVNGVQMVEMLPSEFNIL